MQLGVDVIDLDEAITEEAGKTIPEIFATEGEAAFRDLETKVLAALADRPNSVVALGGGAILSPENRAQIARSGRCVWLQATPETLAARIAADEAEGPVRPSLTGKSPVEEVAEVLASRIDQYASAADYQVTVDEAKIEEIAETILDWLDQQ